MYESPRAELFCAETENTMNLDLFLSSETDNEQGIDNLLSGLI